MPQPTFPPLEEVAELVDSIGHVYSLSCSPDGQTMASGGYSQLNLWEQDWEPATLQGDSSYFWGVHWSSDGSMIASGSQDGGVILWDSANRDEVVRFGDFWVYSVSWQTQNLLDKGKEICYYIVRRYTE